jgi:tRNA threonylcarbamoyladenosine biosynthesis protein TsaB
MYFAGLSSATKEVSVGVIESDSGKVVIDYTVVGAQSKTENLIPQLKLVMEKIGLTPKDLSGIAVTQGPGSYSGLRGSVSAAKTLAQALKIPIYGVSTLETIAYNYANTTGTVLVVLDAVREEDSIALFASSGDQNDANDASIKRLTEDFVIAKDRLEEFKKTIQGNLIIAKDITPKGVNAARIGLKMLQAKVKTNFNKLTPKYSHLPKFVESKR